MPKLSDNYYHRKCFLEREQVPTQSVMKKTMTPALANVYFKSMTPKLKILAGLEPPMKGGGSDWYMPPKDILDGKAVLKPLKKEYLSKLGFNGIAFYGEKFVADYRKQMELEREKVLLENDLNWKRTIDVCSRQQWEDTSKEQSKLNTSKIQQAFQEFTTLYTTSITEIESLLFDAAIKEIERIRKEAYDKMSQHYETLLKQQATMIYDRYTEKLTKEKEKLKAKFVEDLENSKTVLGNQLHDINVEKHMAVEKLRTLMECQNLACQVYVAMKERGEFNKEVELSKHKHEKEIKVLSEHIAMKDFEIKLAREKEQKRHDFNRIWKQKICHVVKRFQEFVKYCLCTLPEHAEFFINMEKLMFLQLSEALENPSLESIFVPDEVERSPTPIPRPHPFFIFCDKGFKPNLNADLCPKHCTSSASQLPVIVVNNKCVYAACDNLEVFSDKVKQFLDGKRGNDEDFVDDHDYTYDIPVKNTTSHDLLHLKLESSLMQILQNEMPNVRKVATECCICKIPYCFCSPLNPSDINVPHLDVSNRVSITQRISSGEKINSRSIELMHEREPKWPSYMQYVLPKCKCAKTAKKHLEEHLPAYMRNMSKYETVDLKHYETCNLDTLKKMVKKAQGLRSPEPAPTKAESKTKDVGTQYSDIEFDFLCTCFSDEEVDKILQLCIQGSNLFNDNADAKFQMVDGSISPTHLQKNQSDFATDAAYALRDVIKDSPELEEIFLKQDCKF